MMPTIVARTGGTEDAQLPHVLPRSGLRHGSSGSTKGVAHG
jgi:hypothetical protein